MIEYVLFFLQVVGAASIMWCISLYFRGTLIVLIYKRQITQPIEQFKAELKEFVIRRSKHDV